MPVIQALERLRQEDQEFEACLGYMVSLVSKNQNKLGVGYISVTSAT
jgi:hypothetical protein